MDDDGRTDEELLLAAGEGDVDAYEILYHRHKERTIRLSMRWVGRRSDALDVLQETFTYLYKKAPDYEPTARFTTFLYKIVHSLSMTVLRKRRRGGPTLQVDPERDVSEAAGPEDRVVASETHRLVSEAIRELSDIHRDVLSFRLEEGLQNTEIAEILDVPVGTVKSRVHHGMEKLRAKLERLGFP